MKKCPVCQLNYINDNEQVCAVCSETKNERNIRKRSRDFDRHDPFWRDVIKVIVEKENNLESIDIEKEIDKRFDNFEKFNESDDIEVMDKVFALSRFIEYALPRYYEAVGFNGDIVLKSAYSIINSIVSKIEDLETAILSEIRKVDSYCERFKENSYYPEEFNYFCKLIYYISEKHSDILTEQIKNEIKLFKKKFENFRFRGNNRARFFEDEFAF